MNQTLNNNNISVPVSEKGGFLLSVKNSQNTEYMWQGDSRYWSGRGFHIFPYVGRLTNETYTLEGKEYHMGIHGLLLDAFLTCVEKDSTSLELKFESNEETKIKYPYHFSYSIKLFVHDNSLTLKYDVCNKDTKKMYFGIGAHPAFNVPIESGESFQDYLLQFEKGIQPQRINMTDDCFVAGGYTPYKFSPDCRIKLQHELFDNDAIVLHNAGNKVSLCNGKGVCRVCLEYEGFEYLMLWAMPHTDAPYVCIEPVSSMCARKGVVEDFAAQKDLLSLNPEEHYKCSVKITFN